MLINSFELLYVFNLALALVCGVVIGFGRELKKKPAGMRTHSLIIAASMTFSYLSPVLGEGDPSRIASHIVVGIGFLGAGIIFQARKGRIMNVTTAASVWFSAAVGMALGFGYYFIAIAASIFTIIVSYLPKISHWLNK